MVSRRARRGRPPSREGLQRSSGSVRGFCDRRHWWYVSGIATMRRLEEYEMTHRREYLEAAVRTAKVFAKAQKRNRPIYYRNYLDGRAETDSPAIIPIPIWPVPLSRSGHARSRVRSGWLTATSGRHSVCDSLPIITISSINNDGLEGPAPTSPSRGEGLRVADNLGAYQLHR